LPSRRRGERPALDRILATNESVPALRRAGIYRARSVRVLMSIRVWSMLPGAVGRASESVSAGFAAAQVCRLLAKS
jgi:hypothetical protein